MGNALSPLSSMHEVILSLSKTGAICTTFPSLVALNDGGVSDYGKDKKVMNIPRAIGICVLAVNLSRPRKKGNGGLFCT